MCAAAATKSSDERRRVALIIGNNRYKNSPLANCVNDATDLSNVLRRVGFDVSTHIDLTYKDMDELIEHFIDSIKSDDIVLFFFAGHGVQWEDQNYLLSCDDNRIEHVDHLKRRAVNAQHILKDMSLKAPFVIVYLLDCCRNYLLPSKARDRGDNSSAGMAPMHAVAGSVVVFACDAGKTAKDQAVNGRNGVFTYHLLQHITTPGEDISNLMRDVTDGVQNETHDTQIPFVTQSLRKRDICLVPRSMATEGSNRKIHKKNPSEARPTMDFPNVAKISLSSSDSK